jgi:predicted transglutaminase-like cysteine proteinase
MRIFRHSHAWRAVVLASIMAWYGHSAQLSAGTLEAARSVEVTGRSVEPFGLFASALSEGGLREKWLGVARKLDDERVQLALCDGDRERCVSPAALQLLAIVDAARARSGRARLGETNRAINLAIRPMSDLAQYGEIDVWSSPLVTLTHGAGDCEDYAIAKFVALRLAGVADDDLRIVIMRDTIHGEDHAVAAARLDGRWLTLDNRRMAMVEDAQVRNYRPTFVIDQHGIMRYSDTPLLAGLPDRDLTRAVALNAAVHQPSLISSSN